jgi:hypothetical protein
MPEGYIGEWHLKIIITDLTRFQKPEIACLAGIDPQTGQCVRPMRSVGNGLDYFQFESVKKHKVIPGSCLEGTFIPVESPPRPHVEDCRAEGAVSVVASASGTDFESVLQNSSSTTVRSAFGSLPNGRLYALDSPPSISIATLRIDVPKHQFRLMIDEKYGPPKFKAHITDAEGVSLNYLPVTDLGFSDHVRSVLKGDPGLLNLNAFLGTQKTLYLRLGLTRQWGPSPDKQGYWVQLNGIYSFPNFRKDLRVYE